MASGPSSSIPGAALRQKCPSAGWPAGENAVGTGQPPVLAAAGPLGTEHLLGRTRPRAGPAEPGKELCGPVHIECLCNFSGRRDRQNPAQPIALRRIRGYAAAVPPLAAPDTWAPNPAPCLGAAPLRKLWMRGGAVAGAGFANAPVRRTGVDGHCRTLAKNPKALMRQGFRAKNAPARWKRLTAACTSQAGHAAWARERRAVHESDH